VARLVFPSLKHKLYKTLANFIAFEALNGHDSFATIHGKAAIMKKLLLLPLALITSGVALAQDVGRVISATPIIQQVGVPRQVCTTEQVAVQQQKSGAGALMGAIAGGAMGYAVGGGAGKAAATVLGLIGGAALGDTVEGGRSAQDQNAQRCTTQNFFENRPVAYNVVYEFGGKQYSVQMPNDPGPTLQLQVSPVGAASRVAPQATTVTYAQPTYQQPASSQPVYQQQTYAQPVYQQPVYVAVEPQVYYVSPGYYSQPNYFPVVTAVGVGWLLGSQRYGYGHARWH
jgi:uncharacterized protein YcfJ